MRRWLTRFVGSVIHNLTPVSGERFLWGHHGMSFIRKEANGPLEIEFQAKNSQTGNSATAGRNGPVMLAVGAQPVPVASSVRSRPQILVGLRARAKLAVIRRMGTRSREVIWSSRISGAKMSAEHAREKAKKAAREADRAEAYAWSVRMEGYGGPAQPSPTIAQCLNSGYGWLEVKCHRCETQASLPLDAIRRPRDTPIWKLEAALKCRSCKKGRYAPPVHMIKLTQQREITPYVWVHPDDER
jgi:hypothetical protein